MKKAAPIAIGILFLLVIYWLALTSNGQSDFQFSLLPYVTFVNPTMEMIRFETNLASNFTINFGPTPFYGRIEANKTLDTMHEISLTELMPDTFYYYNVTAISINRQIRTFNSTFRTAPQGGLAAKSFLFVVMGDSRADTGDGADATQFPRVINHAVRNFNPRFIIMTGDVVTTSGNDYDMIKAAWKTFTHQVENISDHIPILNAIGNHEHVTQSTPNASIRYREIWMHPHNGDGEEGYYEEIVFWQEYGNSLFVFINTEEPSNSPRIVSDQLIWLNHTLQKTGFTHKFVFFHRPICGTTRSGTISNDFPIDSAMLDEIFSKNNVTLAFSGHNHYYCYNKTTSGVTYIITGGAGAPLHSIADALGTVKLSQFHYIVVSVTGTLVNVTMVDIDGIVRHNFLEYGTDLLPWDINGDGIVGINDVLLVVEHFGKESTRPGWKAHYDLNSDSYVGIDDIVTVAEHIEESH